MEFNGILFLLKETTVLNKTEIVCNLYFMSEWD